MGALRGNLQKMKIWWPDRWEAPQRDFIGHRDLVTRSLCRYAFVAPHVQGILLDVGCGRGYGFEILTPRTAGQVGVDVSREFLRKARQQYPSVSLACGIGNALPFADTAFDSVVAFEVIEHVEDDLNFLKELKRVARKDAVIAVSTPNKLLASGDSVKPLDPFHVREYRGTEFYNLLKQAFSSVELFGQHERLGKRVSASSLIDRIPVRWKYSVPHPIQSLLSIALRPPLRLEDCRFNNDDLEHAHTFLALCRP
jgi:SAM-dependent methyltransferase